MCGYVGLAEQFGKLACYPLRHAARVDKYQRGPVLFDQSRQTVVDLLPHLRRHDRFERGIRNVQSEFAVATMAGIHDGAVRTRLAAGGGADQKLRNVLYGSSVSPRARCAAVE